MKRTIKLEDGTSVEISEESYDNLAKAVALPTYEEIQLLLYKNEGVMIDVGGARAITALKKLYVVAKYLNDGWKPKYSQMVTKFYIDGNDKLMASEYKLHKKTSNIYFKDKDTSRKVVQILGEDVIVLALNLNG